MGEEILINVTPMETRVALVENSLLQEIFIERHHNRGHVGDIFYGKVVRVMPGMEAAFVDIGWDKAAFLHSSDIAAIDSDGFEVRDEPAKTIQALLREGQFIIVQVVKDAISSKGARLTTHLTLPSRNLVYLPRSKHRGISQRLEDEAERDRLMAQLQACLEIEKWDDSGGFIIRTAAEGVGAEEFFEEIKFLRRLWSKVEQRIAKTDKISPVYSEVPLYIRSMRDFIAPQVEKIRIDNQQSFLQSKKFLDEFVPEASGIIEEYVDGSSLFDLYGIEDEINRALGRQIKLKSGGDLVIDQTEAMTTIDVNTGGFIGSSNHAETILKTNLEAATAIARQLRLRNLGGIIILDFIDMQDAEHQRQVQRALAKSLEKDRARTSISDISPLGLIEMTRKRTRESLGEILNTPCAVCAGSGRKKSAETVCYEIFRAILRLGRTHKNATLRVLASQLVVDRLLDEELNTLAELQELVAMTVKYEVDPMYTQEQFDVVVSG
jgi:ribonuclease G